MIYTFSYVDDRSKHQDSEVDLALGFMHELGGRGKDNIKCGHHTILSDDKGHAYVGFIEKKLSPENGVWTIEWQFVYKVIPITKVFKLPEHFINKESGKFSFRNRVTSQEKLNEVYEYLLNKQNEVDKPIEDDDAVEDVQLKAYLLAERDGFSNTQEHYWLEAASV